MTAARVVFIVKDWKESQKNLGSALITGPRRDDRFAGISPKLEEIGGVDRLVYGHYCRTKTLIVSDRDRSDITVLDGYCVRADECSEAAPTPTPTPTPAPPADPELTSPVGQPPETPTTPTPVPTASPTIP